MSHFDRASVDEPRRWVTSAVLTNQVTHPKWASCRWFPVSVAALEWRKIRPGSPIWSARGSPCRVASAVPQRPVVYLTRRGLSGTASSPTRSSSGQSAGVAGPVITRPAAAPPSAAMRAAILPAAAVWAAWVVIVSHAATVDRQTFEADDAVIIEGETAVMEDADCGG